MTDRCFYSSEVAFYSCNRGDLLFLTNSDAEPIRAGDLVVFRYQDRYMNIIHRVIQIHEK